ncbi:TPA: DUF2163 domain-containing protein [Aeromonas hydrophila subsp. hydrophila]|nr:DUF2163 domain-containing protein [Aeromonas hydrophila subsp. hydrophila]
MGKKSGQQSQDHKQNLNDLRNSLFTRSNFASSNGVSLTGLRELTEKEAIQYAGLPAMLLNITFNNGAVLNLTTYALDVNFKGVVYQASNEILEIPDLKTEGTIQTEGVTVKLSALNPTIFRLIQDGYARGARLNYKIVFMTPDGKVNANASFNVYSGMIDVCKFNLNLKDKDSTMTVDIETKNTLAKLQRIPGNRHANSIQQELYPGDRVFEYMNAFDTAEWKLKN